MYAQQIDVLLIGLGSSYAGGFVTFYDAGLMSQKDAYTDKDMAGVVANPYTLDSSGRSANPVYGLGWYKIIVTKADLSAPIVWDNLYFGVADSPSNVIQAVARTSNYQATSGDGFISMSCSTGAKTITLPDAIGLTEAVRMTFQKSDATANALTVKGFGAQLIETANTYVVGSQYMTLTVITNATFTGWNIEKANAETLDTFHASATAAANTIPVANANGYLDAAWLTVVAVTGLEMFWPTETAPSGWFEENGSLKSMTSYEALFDVIGVTYGKDAGTAVTFNSTTDILSAAHTLHDGDVITLSNSGGALPTGLTAGLKYYVINSTAGQFQVSLTKGGGAVDFSTAGSGTNYFHTTYKVPDARGRTIRVWDHGAGVDPDAASRTDRGDGTTGDHVGTKQADAFKTHTHVVKILKDSAASEAALQSSAVGQIATFDVTSEATGGNETRMVNTNRMMIIKY